MTNQQLQHHVRARMKNDALYGAMQQAVSDMEERLKELCESAHLPMTKDLERILVAGGKRLRPSLAYVSYSIGTDRQLDIVPLMCMLELMHTASLIHDDVVDQAELRRNVQTIHTTSGKTAAIQSGDYLLGRAMEYLHIYKGTGINEALADVSTQMCLGEFQQMKHLYDPVAQTVDNYYEQVRRKTAYLLATSCYSGGIAGGLDKAQTESLRKFGELIGIAFQLKDDVLDFVGTGIFGKKSCQDLKRGIFTLPLLYAFEQHPDEGMKALAARRDKTQQDLKTLLDYIVHSGGIDYTESQIKECSTRAIEALDLIPEGEGKAALCAMAAELGNRKL